MQIGVAFPHHAIGTDPSVIRDWAQAADDLGFHRVIIYEHVLLPDANAHPTRTFPTPTRRLCTSHSCCADS